MKRLVIIIFSALICGALFTSCSSKAESEERVSTLQNGIYSGIFTHTRQVLTNEQTMSWSWVSSESKFTLELNNGGYICGGDYEGVPSSYGAGTFSVEKDKITFIDEVARIALYSWDWILVGEYNYTFDGKKLKFSKSNDYAKHEYILEKQ